MSTKVKCLCIPLEDADPSEFRDGLITSLFTLIQMPFFDPDAPLDKAEQAAIYNVLELMNKLRKSEEMELPGKPRNSSPRSSTKGIGSVLVEGAI